MEATKEQKQDELALFHKWKSTQDVKHFQDLYESMKPLVYKAARNAAFGSNIPEAAHRIWAAQAFHDALRTYDPKKAAESGASLPTHIYGSVSQKAKRLNYLHQNLGHMPEPRIQAVGTYRNELQFLKDKLGREPSAAELADRLAWGVSDVAAMRKELRKDLAMESGTEDVSFFESNKDEEVLNFLYYDLTGPEKAVYEFLFGKHGQPRMIKSNNRIDYDEISKRTGSSVSKVRYIVASIQKKLEHHLRK